MNSKCLDLNPLLLLFALMEALNFFWFILSFHAWTLIHCNHVNNDIASNDSLFILAINFSFVALATLEFHNCWWHNPHHVQMVAELL
jgi:hypothetical protein